MNSFLRAVNSKIVWINVLTTLLEVGAVLDGVLPQRYLIYTTTAKSILTVILRVWFYNNAPQTKVTFPPEDL
jgi:hypothetical protein